MGAPIFIDSMVLTLGRFLRNRGQERNVPVERVEMSASYREEEAPTLITLSSGQMLLPGIGVTHRFMQ
ncbi:MAG: hypothetical protein WCI03_14965 [bacterium]